VLYTHQQDKNTQPNKYRAGKMINTNNNIKTIAVSVKG
jgi:hypothetical protein